MAITPTRLTAERAAIEYTKRHARKYTIALLGDGAGNVDVTGRDNWVWVRLEADGAQLTQAKVKSAIDHVENLAVMVERVLTNGATNYQVIGLAPVPDYPNSDYDGAVADHSEQHEIRDFGAGGKDKLNIYTRSHVELRARAQATPDMTLFVEHGKYAMNGAEVFWTGGDSPTFTAPSAGYKRFDLLYFDDAGDLQIEQGTAVQSSLFTSPSYPSAPAGAYFPLAYVLLMGGQTTITETSIADARIAWGALGDAAMTAHDIIGAFHMYSGGAAFDVFGLSAVNTIAKLTPSYDVSPGTSAILRSNDGALTLLSLGVTGLLTHAQPSASELKFITLDPHEPLSKNFNWRVNAFGNPYGTRNNVVMRWGYNNGATGVEDAGDAALYQCLETYYAPDASNQLFEQYWEYKNGATEFRPISMTVNRVDNKAYVYYKSDFVYFMSTSGTQYWTMYSGYLEGSNTASVLIKTVNNSAFLRQRNASGLGNVDLMYLNSSDRIYFGATVESHTVSSTLTAQAISDTTPLISRANSSQTARLIRLEKSDGSLIGAIHATPHTNTNVLIGALAGAATISGGVATYNIFVGRSAGGNITGNNNVAIGDDALQGAAGSTAQNNFALGTSCMVNATSAQSCVGIGISALQNITDGKQSIAIGTSSMGNAGSNPTDSVAVGFQAGYTSGNNNVALGSRALFSGGGSAVAIGYNALRNATGNNNTGIGFQAGYSNTGGSGVFIGYQAGYYETVGSKLFIDNANRGNEADGRIKSLVYGVFAAAVANQLLAINGYLYVNGATQSGITNGAARFAGHITPNVDATSDLGTSTLRWAAAYLGGAGGTCKNWNNGGTAITTSQIIIADGTNDVTSNITIVYSVKPSSGTPSGGVVNIPFNGSTAQNSVIWSNDSGTEYLTVTVATDGSVTIERTGTLSYTANMWLVWI